MKDKRRKILILPDQTEAYFHKWVKVRISKKLFDTYALVEHRSGDVRYVRPVDVFFHDWFDTTYKAI